MTAFARALAFATTVAFVISIAAAAQEQVSRMTGRITDGSGGALPGVTITITSPRLSRTVTIVTDGAGRFLSPALPSDTYGLTFVLAGFETRTSAGVFVKPGEVVIVDQQMGLASVAETVEVVAPAPPPPPPAPAPPIELPKRAKPKAVPKEQLATVCGPEQAAGPSLALGQIVAHRDDSKRQLYGNGDALVIDVGTNLGVAMGQNFVVRRRFRFGDRDVPLKLATFGEQTAGLIQVVETSRENSTAVVVYLCGELYAGDLVEAFDALPIVITQDTGVAQFDSPARIVFGEHGQIMGSPGRLMVIDKGLTWGARRGGQITIFRRSLGGEGAITNIGSAVIVAVNADTSTIRIERAIDAISVGDSVALHR
ncbi:MAG: carboxypeptidase-like regulatory domain-containing protein [Acidobacteriota bacterium]|nr:carboxypeptidase-like regulatory domain-containing protein [Acidobacteriota bacterium]